MNFLSDLERTKIVRWQDSDARFIFKSRVDLGGEILVIPQFSWTYSQLLKAQAEFVANFMIWTYPRLNGFAGFDCLKWKLEGKV